ncbi:MAG: hypothetical protein VYE31_01355 [Pseudomonadota bacterium]|nr:hypothetical protein [Pseudomonadota bacterium]
MPNFLINTDKKLKKIFNEIQRSDYLGIDTEFIRESTYYPILALLQISTEKSNYCIDVLEIDDKEKIKEILVKKGTLKIIHSSKQDLEVLYTYYDCFPKTIFDTQIAANLMSIDMNISYSGLVKKFFNIELKEGSWRTDWLERPLSDEKLEYASNDVKYLIPIYKILSKELIKHKRMDWFKEEQEIELKKENIITDPKDAWKKINISTDLTKIQVKKLKFLSEWRENKAIENNLPKKWVMLDTELIKLLLSEKEKVKEILDNFKKSLSKPDKEYISLNLNKLNDNKQKGKFKIQNNKSNQKIKECQKLLDQIAIEYNLPKTLIANKREIDLYSKDQKELRFMSGWRFKIFGKLLQ